MESATPEIELFNQAVIDRRRRYPELAAQSDRAALVHADLLRDFRRDGYVILRNCVSPEAVDALKARMDGYLEAGTHLGAPRNLQGLAPDAPPDAMRSLPRLTQEDMKRGVSYYRNLANSVDIADPLLSCPELAPLAFAEKPMEIAGAYLGCLPAIGFIKMRRTFVNALPPFDTQYFHVDGNAAKLVKAFLYLNDVDHGSGPFTFVRASHINRFPGWLEKDRFTEAEMADAYGAENIVPLTAGPGDVILADTSGFHRGAKPQTRDRYIAIVNYGMHEEYGGGAPKVSISRAALEDFTPGQRAATEFMDVV